MKPVRVAASSVIALLACAGAANAATLLVASGKIESMDTAKHRLVLSTGNTFELGHKVHLKRLHVGEKVKVTYKIAAGKEIAKRITRVN